MTEHGIEHAEGMAKLSAAVARADEASEKLGEVFQDMGRALAEWAGYVEVDGRTILVGYPRLFRAPTPPHRSGPGQSRWRGPWPLAIDGHAYRRRQRARQGRRR